MRLLLPCCVQLPCGIWPVSFCERLRAIEIKNNSMYECFWICLRVAEFAPPMSRRPITKRRESLLPLLMPDRHQIGIVFDPRVPPDPTRTINGKAGQRPEAWARQTTHCRLAKQTSQTIEGAISQLTAGNHLLARLMFRRIRPRNHSGMISEQSCSPHELQPTPALIASPNITAPLLDSAQAPIPSEIEALFTQLVRRRLRSRGTQETQ